MTTDNTRLIGVLAKELIPILDDRMETVVGPDLDYLSKTLLNDLKQKALTGSEADYGGLCAIVLGLALANKIRTLLSPAVGEVNIPHCQCGFNRHVTPDNKVFVYTVHIPLELSTDLEKAAGVNVYWKHINLENPYNVFRDLSNSLDHIVLVFPHHLHSTTKTITGSVSQMLSEVISTVADTWN